MATTEKCALFKKNVLFIYLTHTYTQSKHQQGEQQADGKGEAGCEAQSPTPGIRTEPKADT